ncbi:MAG: DMT family transporter [Lawsonibacter sp.]|nr:DMT family transporter [Lawsonibacter sp.]
MKNKLIYSSFIILECILWGIGNTVTKVGLQSIGPYACLTIRFFLSFLLFVFFFFPKLLNHWTDMKRCIPISIATAAAFILSTLSLSFTSATNAGLLMALSVMFTPLLSLFVYKTRPEKKIIVSVILVVIGVYLLCGIDNGVGFGIGEIMALMSSFCLAVTLTFSAKFVCTMEPAVLSTVQSGITAMISFVFAVRMEDLDTLYNVSISGWLAIAYLVVGCTLIAYLLQNTALKHVSSVFVSIAFCTEPLFTALSAYFILDEKLSGIGYMGALFIIVGITVSSISKRTA